VVCFTANATAAAKLVGESYPFGPRRPLLVASDNHNSVNGLREYARHAGAPVTQIRLTADLRLDDAPAAIRSAAVHASGGLLALPAQSNFSGACHALGLVAEAQRRGWAVLLDAAAWVPTHPLDLGAVPADFVTVSFYKMFGLPTGLGALVARRDAIARLERPWFAGGTVAYVSVAHGRHLLRSGAEGFEDGTPHFLGIAELPFGLAFLDRIGMARIQARVAALTRMFVARLAELRHPGGPPLVAIYGPADIASRGGTIAFNVLDRAGVAVPFGLVETRARSARVAVRGGCFCNPGASEAAFAFDSARSAECFTRLSRDFSSDRLRSCLGDRASVGALRVSFGVPTVWRDAERALDVVRSFAN
jgi:selenocysteine lyase/cysteine desulfurase